MAELENGGRAGGAVLEPSLVLDDSGFVQHVAPYNSDDCFHLQWQRNSMAKRAHVRTMSTL